jgi:catalase
VPGIDFSDDPLLQGRNFSYFDTQISRLGINWQELPINRPVCPFMNHNRDGQMRQTITNSTVNYWPNRYSTVPPVKPEDGGFTSYPENITSRKERLLSKKFQDHYSQAQLFYNSMSDIEKMHIPNALSFELDHCDDPIVYERMSERLSYVDLALAQVVAEKVGGQTPSKAAIANHGRKAPRLSQFDFMPDKPTIATRRIAILINDGFDSVSYNGMVTAIKAAGALPFTIGPRRQKVSPDGNGEGVKPDHHFNGMRSTMFDALFVPGGSGQVALARDGLARFWVREAFGHCKAIGSVGKGNELVKAAISKVQGHEVASADERGVRNWYGVVTAGQAQVEGWGKVIELVKNAKDAKDFIQAFFSEIGQHRNFQRELDGLVMRTSC